MADSKMGIIIGIVAVILILLFVWPGYGYFADKVQGWYNGAKSAFMGAVPA